MKICIYAFTYQGAKLLKKVTSALVQEHEIRAYITQKQYVKIAEESDYGDFPKVVFEGFKELSEDMMAKHFKESDMLLFIGACGIAVRKIAPLIHKKDRDPGVLVIDEGGQFVIPILSGHIGGANVMARFLAGELSAAPVITTATDINHVFSCDSWAIENGFHICNIDKIKEISSAILDGEPVGIYSQFELIGPLPKGLVKDTNMDKGIVLAWDSQLKVFNQTLNLIPKNIFIGLGCKKNIDFASLDEFFTAMLKKNHIKLCRIGAIGSIDLKKEEPALLMLAEKYQLKTVFFTKEDLLKAEGCFTPSAFVKEITGVENVCERAAYLLSGENKMLVSKTVSQGMTFAAAEAKAAVHF